LKAFRSGQIPKIINPNAANDFIYIDDVINEFIRGIELEGAEGIMSLGTSDAATTIEVTQLVERIIHGEASSIKNLSIETVTKEKNQAMIADISKAKATLDWIPKVSLKRGVDLTSKAIKW
jgi:nucleoside-diphosphate-sugar epimerase